MYTYTTIYICAYLNVYTLLYIHKYIHTYTHVFPSVQIIMSVLIVDTIAPKYVQTRMEAFL